MNKINFRRNFDPLLVVLPLAICCIGLFFLYSASRGMQQIKGIDFTIRQAAWILAGLLAFIAVINIDFRRVMDGSYLYYIIIVSLLAAVLFIGGARLGARRWLSIGWFTFQPSEPAKLILILTLAFYLGNNRYSAKSAGTFVMSLFITGALFMLIVKEPDLGSAVALLAIMYAMLIVANIPFKFILGSIFLGAAASPLLWNFLKDYQKSRLLVFLNPNIDPLGTGYTIIQSKIAIGSGGLFGKGWMSGTQNQLNFLPERHTDFIFSVVGEEWGFIGSLTIIILFCALIVRILSVAGRTSDLHGRLLATGVAAMIAFQVIVNIAMTAGLMPVVGLPLPLISYGGSSLLTTWLAIGLAVNVDMHRTVF